MKKPSRTCVADAGYAREWSEMSTLVIIAPHRPTGPRFQRSVALASLREVLVRRSIIGGKQLFRWTRRTERWSSRNSKATALTCGFARDSLVPENKQKPFFLYLALMLPMAYLVPEEWAEPTRDRKTQVRIRNFLRMIANIDHNVGLLGAKAGRSLTSPTNHDPHFH